MKIPTAEELLQQEDCILNDSYRTDFIIKQMIEFTKLHVKAALEAVSEKAYCELRHEGNSDDQIINKQSILESYPESNIK